MSGFYIICNISGNCVIEGQISPGNQSDSLINFNLGVDVEDGEPAGQFELRCNNCGNTVRMNV